MAEFGACHRYEPSGALHGIMRVRGFTQDDAHIFCREDQIEAETTRFVRAAAARSTRPRLRGLHREARRPAAGCAPARTRSGTRPRATLKPRAKAAGLDLIADPGEGAFYGPKLEFLLRDAIGRDWQCGTLQLDFVLPERLDAEYVGRGRLGKQRPVMLHRAIFGSLRAVHRHPDRALRRRVPALAGAGAGGGRHDHVATPTTTPRRSAANCGRPACGSSVDLRNEKINYKVREHSLAKVPVILAVGRRDMDNQTVAIRRLGSEKQEVLELGAAVTTLSKEAQPPF